MDGNVPVCFPVFDFSRVDAVVVDVESAAAASSLDTFSDDAELPLVAEGVVEVVGKSPLLPADAAD